MFDVAFMHGEALRFAEVLGRERPFYVLPAQSIARLLRLASARSIALTTMTTVVPY